MAAGGGVEMMLRHDGVVSSGRGRGDWNLREKNWSKMPLLDIGLFRLTIIWPPQEKRVRLSFAKKNAKSRVISYKI